MDKVDISQQITYYDERFKELHNTAAEELRWSHIHHAILKAYPSTPSKLTVLDLGCSSGWLSDKLKEFGNVTGIDFSEQSISAAKSQFQGIDFRVMDITKDILLLGEEKFDLIISSEVIEHMADQELFVKQISLLLKKGGVLILTTPNGKWHNAYFTVEMLPYKQPIENWVKSGSIKLLLQQGFNLIQLKTFYTNWIYSSRPTIFLKILANDYIRAGLIKINLFNTYLKVLEILGYGLYLLVIAKKKE